MIRLLLIAGLFSQSFSYNVQVFTRDAVLKPFRNGNAFKVIAGLNNFNEQNVRNVVEAAAIGGASHVDIACDPSLVRAAKSVCNLPICVSSIVPLQFLRAVEAGADMIELGNYDGFYDLGLKFTADDILTLTTETKQLLPHVPLSVTIPHTLSISDQVKLAQQLANLEVDIIQTEGKVVASSKPLAERTIVELIEQCGPTLASTFALAQAVPQIPILSSSGMTDITAPVALTMGAKGVGIGAMINRLPSLEAMVSAVMKVSTALHRDITLQHPVIKTILQQQQQQLNESWKV